MPRDPYYLARIRDHQKAANRELAEHHRLVSYDSIYDTPREPFAEATTFGLTDWLNELRARAGILATKIPVFQRQPGPPDKGLIVPLISHALSRGNKVDLFFLRELVRRVGQPAQNELQRISQTSSHPTMRKNAKDALSASGRTVPRTKQIEKSGSGSKRFVTALLSLVQEAPGAPRPCDGKSRNKSRRRSERKRQQHLESQQPPIRGGIGTYSAIRAAHVVRSKPQVKIDNLPKKVEIAGISIPRELLSWSNGVKCLEGGRWRLLTSAGKVIGVFATEAELDDWWRAFHKSQGRPPRALKIKASRVSTVPNSRPKSKPAVAKSKKRKADQRRRRSTSSGPSFTRDALNGPLKPWSTKYDMPEFDCE